MASELWLRNPSNYVREALAAGERKYIFDYGWLVKHKIQIQRWADLHLTGVHYRIITTGAQGSAEYRPGSEDPVAVYPSWQYGYSEGQLEDWAANPVGENRALCSDTRVPLPGRPVFGQEHRIVIMNFPHLQIQAGKALLRLVVELQHDYPDAIFHLHGAANYVELARLGLRAWDADPRMIAAKGTVLLPTGVQVPFGEPLGPHTDWMLALGYTPKDMSIPHKRCIFNIRAMSWAADNFTKDVRLRRTATPSTVVDTVTPDADYEPEEDNRVFFRNKIRREPGDRIACDRCSLFTACKFARKGSVCTVPGSEPKALASYFGTRDAGTIIDGLSRIVQKGADRLEAGMELEENTGQLSEHVSRIAKDVFDQGTKLAKLLDPTLRAPSTQINVGVERGGQAAIGLADPRQIIAATMREFERQGLSRDQVTQEMIENALRGAGARTTPAAIDPSRIIEGGIAQPRRAPVVDVSDLPF